MAPPSNMSSSSDNKKQKDNKPVMKVQVIGTKNDAVNYVDRVAVRAILRHPRYKDHIAIMHVEKGSYFKLPGGGIEGDEDHGVALAREVMEKTGYKISEDVGTFFAKSEEFRNELHQVSYCYIVKSIGGTGHPDLTELKVAEGLTYRWVSLTTAIQIMREIHPETELGKFVKARDLEFVEKFALLYYNGKAE